MQNTRRPVDAVPIGINDLLSMIIVGQLRPVPRPSDLLVAGETLDLVFSPTPSAFTERRSEIILTITGLQPGNSNVARAPSPGRLFLQPEPRPGAQNATLNLVDAGQLFDAPPRALRFRQGAQSVRISLTASRNVAQEALVLIQVFNRMRPEQPPAQTLIKVVPRR